jgi:hypothetical protein
MIERGEGIKGEEEGGARGASREGEVDDPGSGQISSDQASVERSKDSKEID